MQAELILKHYCQDLPPRRVRQAERFIQAFRAHRPEETAKAEAALALFRQYDVQKPSGQREDPAPLGRARRCGPVRGRECLPKNPSG